MGLCKDFGRYSLTGVQSLFSVKIDETTDLPSEIMDIAYCRLIRKKTLEQQATTCKDHAGVLTWY
jgi:hypothetical protein